MDYCATYRCNIYHSFVQPPCADLDAGAEYLEMFLNPSKVSLKLYLIQYVIFPIFVRPAHIPDIIHFF